MADNRKKTEAGTWAIVAALLLFIAYELGQGIWLGRMDDFIFEQYDALYFFDHPILFSMQFLGLAIIGYCIGKWAWSTMARH